MYKRILLAYDGSDTGQQALLACHDIAQWSGSELTLIAVMPLPLTTLGPEGGVYSESLHDGEKQRYQTILDAGVRRLVDGGLSARGELVVGDAVTEIVRCARAIDANLIVVDHKHLEGWAARWWRGAVSKNLIEHASCSVLVVITH